MGYNEVSMVGREDLRPIALDTCHRFVPDLETRRLETVLQHMTVGFFACDADWRFLFMNTTAGRILRRRRDHLLGHNFWEVFPQTRNTRLEEGYLRAAAGEIRDFENFYEPWGRWFHNRCFPRQAGGMFCSFFDITPKKLVAATLRATVPDQQGKAIDQTELVVRFCRDNDVCTFVSDVFCRFLGITRESVLGRAWQSLVKADDLPLLESALRRLTPQDPVVTLDVRISNGTGAVRSLRMVNRGIFDDQGRQVEIQAVGCDITECRQLEERYRFLEETTTHLIWETDRSANYTYLSPTFEEITGYSPSAFLGRSFLDLLPKDRAEAIGQQLGTALLASQRFTALEAPVRHRDGQLILLVVSGVPVAGPDGRIQGLRGAFRDVTADKRAEAERQRLDDQLHQAQQMAAIGRLAGGVAQDVNNMLSVILSYAEMALTRVDPNSPLYEDLTQIHCAGLRSPDLVRQLRTSARTEASALGQGTTIPLVALAHKGEGDAPSLADTDQWPPGGRESVLIVDDESSILKIAQHMLEQLGYTVCTAEGPSEALKVVASHEGPLHLLLTDVVMPAMSGRDLVPRIQALHPGIRVLYMSGDRKSVV